MNVKFTGMIVGGAKAGQWYDSETPFFKVAILEPFDINSRLPITYKSIYYDHYPLRFEDKHDREHKFDIWLLEGMEPHEALLEIYKGYSESCRQSRDKDQA